MSEFSKNESVELPVPNCELVVLQDQRYYNELNTRRLNCILLQQQIEAQTLQAS